MPLKIVHTADVHLQEDGDERWQALEQVINLGQKKHADALVISGDLFDKEAAAEALRPKIRGLFSRAGFQIVLIPGNHDAAAYRAGLYFGEGCKIINSIDDCPFQYKGVNFFGLPFQKQSQGQVLEQLYSLSRKANPNERNILLYHGELLDTFFQRNDFGDEGNKRYMPAHLSYFKGLGFDYVLSGHFHTKFHDLQFGDKQFFVYPGSPVSITKKETGPRMVDLFEVGSQPTPQQIDMPYFEEVKIQLSPFDTEQAPQKNLEQALKGLGPKAKALLSIQGFVNCSQFKTTEQDLIKEIKKKIDKSQVVEADLQFKDISYVLEDDLFQDFNTRLQAKDWDPVQKQGIRDLVLRAMTEALITPIP